MIHKYTVFLCVLVLAVNNTALYSGHSTTVVPMYTKHDTRVHSTSTSDCTSNTKLHGTVRANLVVVRAIPAYTVLVPISNQYRVYRLTICIVPTRYTT